MPWHVLFIASVLFSAPLLNSNWSMAAPPNMLLILADNWRAPHAGVLGDPLAQTPVFDALAKSGVLFKRAFNPVPSCSPTRACLLTGKYAHQLGERASLWSAFPRTDVVITDQLVSHGYQIGYSGKGWGPGDFKVSGWQTNPCGPAFKSVKEFLDQRDPARPFFFWIGNTDTATKGGKHPYLEEAQTFVDEDQLVIPPELPDCPELRRDLMNYYGGIRKLDLMAKEAIDALHEHQCFDQTVVIYGSDNGWQMPRGLANCYDSGSHVPLLIHDGRKPNQNVVVDSFVSVGDLGPTILELAGIEPSPEMTMHSLVPWLQDASQAQSRDAVFIERERHADVRGSHLSYPMRAIRTQDYLYIWNVRPDRWPAGDPDVFFLHGRPFGDVDTTAVKDFLLTHQHDLAYEAYFRRIFGKRPEEELYDLKRDPHQLINVADQKVYSETCQSLRQRIEQWMKETHDPRVDPHYDAWDHYRYYGKAPK